MDLVIQLILLPIGVVFGGLAQRRHHRSLEARETASTIRVDNRKLVTEPGQVVDATLVIGQVVVATDYWKTLTTQLRNLVGGEMKAAHQLMDRGRREAILRLCDEAQRFGAQEVWNLRLEFCNVGMMRGRTGGAMQVEVVAYGTAVRRADRPAA